MCHWYQLNTIRSYFEYFLMYIYKLFTYMYISAYALIERNIIGEETLQQVCLHN